MPAAVTCSGARAADHVHHAHRRASARGALDVDDLVVVAHRKVHRLAGLCVQLAHDGQREFAHADARLDQIAELEQPHAEAVGAGLDAVDDAIGGHRRQDAVCGRGVQPGVLRDLLQAERLGMLGEHVEQLHHPLDDLDRAFLVALGVHGARHCSVTHAVIPRCETRRSCVLSSSPACASDSS